ncbi:MAG: hypothetical protein WCB04_02885, partial [Mycobacteriales bacterium]
MLPGKVVTKVEVNQQGAGVLECTAPFPPAVDGAGTVDFTIMDGYYDTSGYVSANARDDVLKDFNEEKQRRAAKSFPPGSPYIDKLFDAAEFGPDAYYHDSLYADTGDGKAGAIRTELIVVRQTLPFVVVVKIDRGDTSMHDDDFTKPDFRHAAV